MIGLALRLTVAGQRRTGCEATSPDFPCYARGLQRLRASDSLLNDTIWLWQQYSPRCECCQVRGEGGLVTPKPGNKRPTLQKCK